MKIQDLSKTLDTQSLHRVRGGDLSNDQTSGDKFAAFLGTLKGL